MKITIAHSPDSDDAFNFYAWEHERVALPRPWRANFERDHIIALNRAAQEGVHDVTSVSSAIYPALAENYYVLAVGTSVGRGYGPVLAAKDGSLALRDMRGRRVAWCCWMIWL